MHVRVQTLDSAWETLGVKHRLVMTTLRCRTLWIEGLRNEYFTSVSRQISRGCFTGTCFGSSWDAARRRCVPINPFKDIQKLHIRYSKYLSYRMSILTWCRRLLCFYELVWHRACIWAFPNPVCWQLQHCWERRKIHHSRAEYYVDRIDVPVEDVQRVHMTDCQIYFVITC